jgi:murein DD-endopeptidase MepM/ murein hydrolase activator NlpD
MSRAPNTALDWDPGFYRPQGAPARLALGVVAAAFALGSALGLVLAVQPHLTAPPPSGRSALVRPIVARLANLEPDPRIAKGLPERAAPALETDPAPRPPILRASAVAAAAAPAAALAPPTAPPAAPPPIRYTVQGGDSLSRIAGQYGVSIDALMVANGITNPGLIYPDQALVIPAAGAGAPIPGAATLLVPAPAVVARLQPDYLVTGPPALNGAQIESILALYRSPARGLGPAFYAAGLRYGLDPAYGLAFFVHESKAGTRGNAAINRSVGNLRAGPGEPNFAGYRTYDTWEAGIDDWFSIIRRQYVDALGLRTVAAIVPRYAAQQDPQDLASYIGDIQTLVRSWRGTGVAAGVAASRPPGPIVLPAPNGRGRLTPQVLYLTTEFGHYPDGSAHYGLDLNAPLGTPLTAPVGGTIEEVHVGCVAGLQTCGRGWGNHIWWKSAVTGHHILLAHFSQIDPAIRVGMEIAPGTLLGLSGSTGFSTGPHVHVQVNADGPADTGAFDPSFEFPWLNCGSTSPRLGQPWGAASCR